MAIVDMDYAETGYITGGLSIGIEVKKSVEPRHDMQAILELLLASVHLRFQSSCFLLI